MMQTMTRGNESSVATGYLLVAFELSQRWWKVGFTTGMGHRVRTRRIAAGALEPLAQAIADAKKMFGLAAEARVISCYEAGRDRGITRAGNAHVRRLMVQLAWGWLRWQSDSALAQWYQRRFATGGSRQRRLGSSRWRGNF
jgi:transposase